jgi:S-adenosylmethionine synthetase
MSSNIQIIKSDLSNKDVIFVERKGIGHPDTLADHLAEHLSRRYSQYTLDKYDAVLHHNFDKSGILGGKSKVDFGSGVLTSPIRVMINGRVSVSFGRDTVPYDEILTKAVYEFFEMRFAELVPPEMISIEFNISTASSPGHVDENETKGSARGYWFNPRDLNDLPERKQLFSNDTSIGSGYYPLHPLESFVLELEKELTIGSFAKQYKWMGSDVKIMGSQIGDTIDITLCAPQIANLVASLEAYKLNIKTITQFLETFAAQKLDHTNVTFSINTRDNYETEELYLTATGSSIESGDEGLVGRGNRVNEIISINHTMSMEGASGKNPVYHIGKLYYIAAHRIARKLFEKFGINNEVYLVSQSGRTLVDPWKVVVKADIAAVPDVEIAAIEQFIREELQSIPTITTDLINGALTIA